MPAIFWTTPEAMVVLPCCVSSARRAGVAPAVRPLDTAAASEPVAVLGLCVMVWRSLCASLGRAGCWDGTAGAGCRPDTRGTRAAPIRHAVSPERSNGMTGITRAVPQEQPVLVGEDAGQVQRPRSVE